MRGVINYKYIAEAVEHYKRKGYEYIEVPWMVTRTPLDVTRPPQARPFKVVIGNEPDIEPMLYLVASGEQSFLYIRKDLCPGRKYITVTPCFRDEPVTDEIHHLDFMKAELIVPVWKTDDPKSILDDMVSDAWNFFRHYTHAETVKTEEGIDITVGGIEVGSYGIREHNGFRWVYGTGVAEPRFSYARAKYEKVIEDEIVELTR